MWCSHRGESLTANNLNSKSCNMKLHITLFSSFGQNSCLFLYLDYFTLQLCHEREESINKCSRTNRSFDSWIKMKWGSFTYDALTKTNQGHEKLNILKTKVRTALFLFLWPLECLKAQLMQQLNTDHLNTLKKTLSNTNSGRKGQSYKDFLWS